jgi:hypothetical protein
MKHAVKFLASMPIVAPVLSGCAAGSDASATTAKMATNMGDDSGKAGGDSARSLLTAALK